MTRLIAPALFLLATPALADLTAEEVLADHLNLLSLYGALEMETTGTRMAPDGLVVEGFTGLWESEDLTARITTPGVTLTETPDGAVTLTYADRLPITLVIDPEGAEEQRIDLTLDAQGLTHRVTGAANDLTHAIAFDLLQSDRRDKAFDCDD